MIFKRFRILVAVIILLLAAWMVSEAVEEILRAFREGQATGSLLMPIMKIVGGLLVLGAFYYALISASRIKTVLENIFAIPELLKKVGAQGFQKVRRRPVVKAGKQWGN